MKIDIELRDGWWDYSVHLGKRHLCGTASDLETALDGVARAAKAIQQKKLNPNRNP